MKLGIALILQCHMASNVTVLAYRCRNYFTRLILLLIKENVTAL